MGSFIHFVLICLLQAIHKFEGEYFHFFGIHIALNSAEYGILLHVCLYQVWWQSDRNYDFYKVFKILEQRISASIGSIKHKFWENV